MAAQARGARAPLSQNWLEEVKGWVANFLVPSVHLAG